MPPVPAVDFINLLNRGLEPFGIRAMLPALGSRQRVLVADDRDWEAAAAIMSALVNGSIDSSSSSVIASSMRNATS
jgi:hypothetical protein